ncbi:hypothetical protein NPIL_520791 [Nephila pilipes]|uniref:Uncharacterized protein n=1 Tax=Nephila pilipes TaxID=299642 RepID=A0A8X6NM25_NEPPI|nr:hypothetical protein NPIL_520791 [Nephila pilipes]
MSTSRCGLNKKAALRTDFVITSVYLVLVQFTLQSSLKTFRTDQLCKVKMMFSVVSRTLLIVALVCISLNCYEARPADEDGAAASDDSTPDPTATTAADGGSDGTATILDTAASTPAAGDGTTGDAAGSTPGDAPADDAAPEDARRR